MKRRKYIIFSLIALLAVASVVFFVSVNTTPQIKTFYGEYDYDPSNIYESVGAHSYVFAGTVEEILGVEYPNRSTCVLENGEEVEIDGNMYTKLRVKITECIKGGLPVGETKTMLKLGGYDADDNAYYLCSGDTYPQLGSEYIFLAEEKEDGIIVVAADYATIPLDNNGSAIASYSTETVLTRQSVIDEYIDAYEHEIPLGENPSEDSCEMDVSISVGGKDELTDEAYEVSRSARSDDIISTVESIVTEHCNAEISQIAVEPSVTSGCNCLTMVLSEGSVEDVRVSNCDNLYFALEKYSFTTGEIKEFSITLKDNTGEDIIYMSGNFDFGDYSMWINQDVNEIVLDTGPVRTTGDSSDVYVENSDYEETIDSIYD